MNRAAESLKCVENFPEGGAVSGARVRCWEWGEEEQRQNRKGGAVNHRHCLASTQEKKAGSISFIWGYTCCIMLGYQLHLETKRLLKRALRDKAVKSTFTLMFSESRLRPKGKE